MTDEQRWQRQIEGFRQGDPEVIQEFWQHYGPMLQRVAQAQLAQPLRRRIDPEDIVQSACRTFFRRVQGGELQLTDSESLWRLLCAITLNKAREQARFHSQQKRGMSREVHAAEADGDSGRDDFGLAAPGPTPEEAAAFADEFERLLRSLDEEERQIVDLKLQECTHDEVAQRLGISERTVRRLFKRVQAKLERALNDATRSSHGR
jgi:RNA polymerase sigma-70 factor (ECF subfamily)